jgi:hypothetical protein
LAENLEEHSSEGIMLGAHQDVTVSQRTLAAACRHGASGFEGQVNDKEATLKVVGEDIEKKVRKIQSTVSQETDYEANERFD